MNTIEEIRKRNLAILFKESGVRYAIDFCKKANIPGPQYSMYKQGKKGMDPKTARKIENAFKKERGWLDNLPEIQRFSLSSAGEFDIKSTVLLLDKLPDKVKADINSLIITLSQQLEILSEYHLTINPKQSLNWIHSEHNTTLQKQPGGTAETGGDKIKKTR